MPSKLVQYVDTSSTIMSLSQWQSCQSINELNHENQWALLKMEGFVGKHSLFHPTIPFFVEFLLLFQFICGLECGKALICSGMLATQASMKYTSELAWVCSSVPVTTLPTARREGVCKEQHSQQLVVVNYPSIIKFTMQSKKLDNERVSFCGTICSRTNDPRSLNHNSASNEPMNPNAPRRFLVPLMHHDPSNLGSLILINPKKHTLIKFWVTAGSHCRGLIMYKCISKPSSTLSFNSKRFLHLAQFPFAILAVLDHKPISEFCTLGVKNVKCKNKMFKFKNLALKSSYQRVDQVKCCLSGLKLKKILNFLF